MQKRYPKRCFSIPERIPEIIKYREHPISRVTFSPDSWSYWGSYFKYRKRCLCALEPKRWCCCRVLPARCVAMCALELGRWCCCKVPLPDVWPCARWSLGAGVAALVLPTMLASFLRQRQQQACSSQGKKVNNPGISHTEDSIHIS